MNDFGQDFGDDEFRRNTIMILEIHRIDQFIDIVKNQGEGLNVGALPGMTERALEALKVYGRFGLTACELCQKSTPDSGLGSLNLYLEFPYEKKHKISRSGVAMLLYRLKRSGLADRQMEGREFRYFINKNGVNRLAYYAKMRENLDQQRKHEQAMDDRLKLLRSEYDANYKLVKRLIDHNRKIGSCFQSHNLYVSTPQIYSLLWNQIKELVDVIHFFQDSILSGNPERQILAFQKGTQGLINLEKTISLLHATLQT